MMMVRFISVCLLALSLYGCNDNDFNIIQIIKPQPEQGSHKLILQLSVDPFINSVVTKGETPITILNNIQILLFDSDSICTKVTPIEPISLDEKNTTSITLSVPVSTSSITVLGNAIGFTSTTQVNFIGLTRSQIFFITRNPSNDFNYSYYKEPEQLFEGHVGVGKIEANETTTVNVNITRVISKIVVQLNEKLQFTDNDGKGFAAINSPTPVYISGIDSLFIIDTPAGVNLPITQYWNKLIGVKCMVFKPTEFTINSGGNLSDSIYVFPQIASPRLPYVIVSVTGSKNKTDIGTGSIKSLYYGIRIQNLTDAQGNNMDITSLPRNSVITLTINDFSGSGFDNELPDPYRIGTLVVNATVQDWGSYYNSGGNAE